MNVLMDAEALNAAAIGAAGRRFIKVALARVAQMPSRPYLLADPCVYCYRPAETRDHIVAVSRGGTDRYGNVVPACQSCNVRKGATPLLIFLANRNRADVQGKASDFLRRNERLLDAVLDLSPAYNRGRSRPRRR